MTSKKITEANKSDSVENYLANITSTNTTNQATELTTFALKRIDLFFDKNKQVYARDKNTQEVWQLASRKFCDWLLSSFYEKNKKIIRISSLNETLSTLAGFGRKNGALHEINMRVATINGSYYIDLCQQGNSKAIKITPNGWEVIESPPVMFIRPDSMQALPCPEKGSDALDCLWETCNIPKDCRILIVAFILECLRPDTPYPVLEILGEQGSAKSTTQSILRRLIDPNSCDLRAAPKSVDDLFVSAGSNHIISCENVSHLTPVIQDGMCTISTGGGIAKRKLFFDCDEIIIHAKNPVMINGITSVISAQDLIDRAISIDLPLIVSREESPILLKKFNRYQSKILGSLLNIFSKALSKLPYIDIPSNERPRLVEFSKLGIGVSEAMGYHGSEFMKSFNRVRLTAIERTIEDNPIATAILQWFEDSDKKTMELPLHEVLKQLEKYHPRSSDIWPKTSKALGDALRRLAPALRQLGVSVKSRGKHGAYVRWVFSTCDSQLISSLPCLHVSSEQDLKT